MTHPLTPREKVALKPCPFCGGTATRYTAIASHPNRQVSCGTCGASAFDIKWNRRTALASGSGDHAELARLAEAATPGPWFRGHNEHGSSQGEMSVWPDAGMVGGVIAKCGWQAPWDGWFEQPAKDAAFIAAANPATVLALIAEVAALRAKIDAHRQTIADDTARMITLGQKADRATEAERKLAEAVGLLGTLSLMFHPDSAHGRHIRTFLECSR